MRAAGATDDGERADAGDGLEAVHGVAHRARLLAQGAIERAYLLGCLAPNRVGLLDMGREVRGHDIRRAQPSPVGVRAQAFARAGLASCAAEEALHRVHLPDLEADKCRRRDSVVRSALIAGEGTCTTAR